MLISLAELPEALRARIEGLRECVSSALADFAAHHSAFRYRYSLRTEASIIHDYMCFLAKERFSWRQKRNLFLVAVEGYRVKLKKMTGRWKTRSIPTQLALDFVRQKPLRLFDDFDVEHVFLGYERNDAEITKSKIWLVCPDGLGRFKWIADLTLAEPETIQIAAATDVATDADRAAEEPARKRRVKGKKGDDAHVDIPKADTQE